MQVRSRGPSRSWPIGAGCTGSVIDIFQADPRRSSLHGGWRGGLSGADFGLRLGGQDEFELIEQEREFGFWFGVAGQQQLSAVGRRDMQINHLHGGELFDGAARHEARRQGMEAPAECDMEAIGEEGDEDMRLDARCILVKDRPDGEVAFEVPERLLDADNWRYKPHSRAGSSSVRLVRKRYRPSRRRAWRSFARSRRELSSALSAETSIAIRRQA